MKNEIIRAKKHLDPCNDANCKFSVKGTKCCYGRRSSGCYMELDDANVIYKPDLETMLIEKEWNKYINERAPVEDPMTEKFCKFCDHLTTEPQEVIDKGSGILDFSNEYIDKPFCKHIGLHLEFIGRMRDLNGKTHCVHYKRDGMD